MGYPKGPPPLYLTLSVRCYQNCQILVMSILFSKPLLMPDWHLVLQYKCIEVEQSSPVHQFNWAKQSACTTRINLTLQLGSKNVRSEYPILVPERSMIPAIRLCRQNIVVTFSCIIFLLLGHILFTQKGLLSGHPN